MSAVAIVAGVGAVVAFLFAWSLCTAAGRADELTERARHGVGDERLERARLEAIDERRAANHLYGRNGNTSTQGAPRRPPVR